MKKYFLILILIFATISCSDLLDTVPGDATTDANFPNSVGDLNQMVLGTYSAYPGRAWIEASSLISDDVRIAPTNTGQGTFLYDWSYNSTTSNFEAIFDSFYVSINRANQVIQNFERIIPTEDELADYNQIISEAYGMRALSHFMLLQVYSSSYSPSNLGVPYVTSLEIEQQPARSTAGEVIQLIKQDISDALSFANSDIGTIDRTRLNYFGIKALLSKVYLYEGEYESSIAEADEVLSQFSIADATSFPNIWNDTFEGNVIFKIGKDATNAGDNASGDLGGIYTRTSNGDIFFNPSDEVRNLYEPGDIRTSVYYTGSGTTAQVIKYQSSDGQANLNDIKVFRAEDILLVRAEAKLMLSSPDFSSAQSDVNLLRQNRNATDVSFNLLQPSLDILYNERRRELTYEGHRVVDAKRLSKVFSRETDDCINLINCELTDVNRYTYPIPQDEIFANNNMVQNPGYN